MGLEGPSGDAEVEAETSLRGEDLAQESGSGASAGPKPEAEQIDESKRNEDASGVDANAGVCVGIEGQAKEGCGDDEVAPGATVGPMRNSTETTVEYTDQTLHDDGLDSVSMLTLLSQVDRLLVIEEAIKARGAEADDDVAAMDELMSTLARLDAAEQALKARQAPAAPTSVAEYVAQMLLLVESMGEQSIAIAQREWNSMARAHLPDAGQGAEAKVATFLKPLMDEDSTHAPRLPVISQGNGGLTFTAASIQARTNEYRSAMAAYLKEIEPVIMVYFEKDFEAQCQAREALSAKREAVWRGQLETLREHQKDVADKLAVSVAQALDRKYTRELADETMLLKKQTDAHICSSKQELSTVWGAEDLIGAAEVAKLQVSADSIQESIEHRAEAPHRYRAMMMVQLAALEVKEALRGAGSAHTLRDSLRALRVVCGDQTFAQSDALEALQVVLPSIAQGLDGVADLQQLVEEFEKLCEAAHNATLLSHSEEGESPSLAERLVASAAAALRFPMGLQTAGGDEGALLRAAAALSEGRLHQAVAEVESLASVHAQSLLHDWLINARRRLVVEQAVSVLISASTATGGVCNTR